MHLVHVLMILGLTRLGDYFIFLAAVELSVTM